MIKEIVEKIKEKLKKPYKEYDTKKKKYFWKFY